MIKPLEPLCSRGFPVCYPDTIDAAPDSSKFSSPFYFEYALGYPQYLLLSRPPQNCDTILQKARVVSCTTTTPHSGRTSKAFPKSGNKIGIGGKATNGRNRLDRQLTGPQVSFRSLEAAVAQILGERHAYRRMKNH